jgi:hypothetical protein
MADSKHEADYAGMRLTGDFEIVFVLFVYVLVLVLASRLCRVRSSMVVM